MAIDLSTIRTDVKPPVPTPSFEASEAILKQMGVSDDILKDKRLVHNFLTQQYTKFYNLEHRAEIFEQAASIPSVTDVYGVDYYKVSNNLGQGDLTVDESQALDGWMEDLQQKMGFAKSASASPGSGDFTGMDAPQDNSELIGNWSEEVKALWDEFVKTGKANQLPGGSGLAPVGSMEEIMLISNLQFESREIEERYQEAIAAAMAKGPQGALEAILLMIERFTEKSDIALGKLVNILGEKDTERANSMAKYDLLTEGGGVPAPHELAKITNESQQNSMATMSITQMIQKVITDRDRVQQAGSSILTSFDRAAQQGITTLKAMS